MKLKKTKVGGWSRNEEDAPEAFKLWVNYVWGKEWGKEILEASEGISGWETDLRRGFVAGFLTAKERMRQDLYKGEENYV